MKVSSLLWETHTVWLIYPGKTIQRKNGKRNYDLVTAMPEAGSILLEAVRSPLYPWLCVAMVWIFPHQTWAVFSMRVQSNHLYKDRDMKALPTVTISVPFKGGFVQPLSSLPSCVLPCLDTARRSSYQVRCCCLHLKLPDSWTMKRRISGFDESPWHWCLS